MRVPAWATAATVNGARAANGTWHSLACAAGAAECVATIDFAPAVRVERGGAGGGANAAASVHRGALMYAAGVVARSNPVVPPLTRRAPGSRRYSMPFAANFTQYNNETYFGAGRQAANDYEAALRAGERWAWALDADPAAPEATLKFEQRATTAARAPFNHSGWPVAVSARALPLDNWEVVKGSAASPPASPACAGEAAEHCGAAETVTLVPHGGTDLRMGMLPLAFHE